MLLEIHRGKYRAGWDEIRRVRYERMIDMGLIDSDWELTSRHDRAMAWSDFDEEKKGDMVKRMATYAAQIDEMDHNIGMLIKFLEGKDQLNNTLILYS